MNKINVIIGLTSNDMLWQALVKFLEDVPDIDLEQADNQFRLNQALSSEDSNVLILEKSIESDESDFLRYLELNPKLGIITIDPVGTQTLIRLSNTGCNQLVELIRALGNDNIKKSSLDERLFHLTILDQSSPDNASVVDLSDHLQNDNSSTYLSDICEWLDLTLLIYFKGLGTANNETNVPGWAMSATHAQSLLSDTYQPLSKDELMQIRSETETKLDNQIRTNSTSRFARFVRAFNLKEIETKIIMLVLAPELDDRYARIYGYINDDLTQKRPSASTIKQLVFGQSMFAFDVNQILKQFNSLAKYQLVQPDSGNNFPDSMKGLKLAKEIIIYLCSHPEQSPNYSKFLQLVENDNDLVKKVVSQDEAIQQKIIQWQSIFKQQGIAPILQLFGDEVCLQWFKNEALIQNNSVLLFKPQVGDGEHSSIEEQFSSALHVALIHKAILIVSKLDNSKAVGNHDLTTLLFDRLVKLSPQLVIHGKNIPKLTESREIWPIERELPDFNARAKLWINKARLVDISLTESDAAMLASTIRFDVPEIEATLSLCSSHDKNQDNLKIIQTAARKIAQQKIPDLVHRQEAVFDWNDIILPDVTIASLRQITGHVRHAGEVFENWGYQSRFPSGSGVAALFNGPSGTGKTMAAQIIAHELGVELFQIDLANTVSKYIGETEKNLRVIFDAAESASAVLLFDEADALFGKRTEVKDAHDRYANVEVAYLLQRIETYSGLAILTTNLKQNLDSAFLRRLRFVIDFPIPTAEHREAIWKCVFPEQAKISSDVDFRFLARRLQLTGGHIQQIAIRAAFAAVAESDQVHMKHIVQATREELVKLGMLDSERSLIEWTPKLVSGVAS